MNYLNFTKYIYLAVGLFMAYDAASRWNENPKPWLSVMLAVLGVFMYFFRRNFAKRFDQHQKQQEQKKPDA